MMMHLLSLLSLCGLLFISSVLLTYLSRYYALRKNLLDIPNERSSHQIPTPRGGGIAIVVTFTATLSGLVMTHTIPLDLFLALGIGSALIALIGYMDDRYDLAVRLRISMHFFAAGWALFWIGGWTTLNLGTWQFSLPYLGSLLGIIGIVWCTNLYNFMDGIDGLASSEGLFVALAGSVALSLNGEFALALTLLLLAMAIAGFMVWNWPPAKIFLGDVGSSYLGFIFSVLSIYCAKTATLPIYFWLITLAIFLCDATFTLLYRVLQGKRWYSAHREHAYQKLIIVGASHQQVSLQVAMLNLLVLFPVAMLALYQPAAAAWLLLFTLVSLFSLWSYITLQKFSWSRTT